MATVTKGKTLGSTATQADFHDMVDNATVTNIVAADISNSAITTAKLANDAVEESKCNFSNVKKIVWNDPTTAALTVTNSSSATWADLDLTAYTSSVATAAYLRVFVRDTTAEGIGMSFRKDSGSATWFIAVTNMTSATRGMYHSFWIPLGDGQVIQYSKEAGGSGTLSGNVYVLGYQENFSA